jgi:ubiquinone/menaquinone biosynthesis C-methylase UbiE
VSVPRKPGNHFAAIYGKRAAQYHELVMREDTAGNLRRALAGIAPFPGATVVELGAGTGRVTKMLSAMAGRVIAFDRSRHMLDRGALHLAEELRRNVSLAEADNRSVPLPDGAADIVVEGWSFGHTVMDAEGAWKEAAQGIIAEAMRLLRPGGTAILVETLGTGCRSPEPPGPIFPLFFAWLEQERGFARHWIRTDYTFETAAKAAELVPFFFGQMVEHDLLPTGEVTVPECTGIWWKRKQR